MASRDSDEGSEEQQEITYIWGKKRETKREGGVVKQFYDSFERAGVTFSLGDVCYFTPENAQTDPPYVGKLVDLWNELGEDEPQRCLVRWFFRPNKDIEAASDGLRQWRQKLNLLPKHKKGHRKKQVFISFNERLDDTTAVEDENWLQSIQQKVSIVCTAKHPNCRAPTAEELENCHHWFDSSYCASRGSLVHSITPVLKGLSAERLFHTQYVPDQPASPPVSPGHPAQGVLQPANYKPSNKAKKYASDSDSDVPLRTPKEAKASKLKSTENEAKGPEKLKKLDQKSGEIPKVKIALALKKQQAARGGSGKSQEPEKTKKEGVSEGKDSVRKVESLQTPKASPKAEEGGAWKQAYEKYLPETKPPEQETKPVQKQTEDVKVAKVGGSSSAPLMKKSSSMQADREKSVLGKRPAESNIARPTKLQKGEKAGERLLKQSDGEAVKKLQKVGSLDRKIQPVSNTETAVKPRNEEEGKKMERVEREKGAVTKTERPLKLSQDGEKTKKLQKTGSMEREKKLQKLGSGTLQRASEAQAKKSGGVGKIKLGPKKSEAKGVTQKDKKTAPKQTLREQRAELLSMLESPAKKKVPKADESKKDGDKKALESASSSSSGDSSGEGSSSSESDEEKVEDKAGKDGQKLKPELTKSGSGVLGEGQKSPKDPTTQAPLTKQPSDVARGKPESGDAAVVLDAKASKNDSPKDGSQKATVLSKARPDSAKLQKSNSVKRPEAKTTAPAEVDLLGGILSDMTSTFKPGRMLYEENDETFRETKITWKEPLTETRFIDKTPPSTPTYQGQCAPVSHADFLAKRRQEQHEERVKREQAKIEGQQEDDKETTDMWQQETAPRDEYFEGGDSFMETDDVNGPDTRSALGLDNPGVAEGVKRPALPGILKQGGSGSVSGLITAERMSPLSRASPPGWSEVSPIRQASPKEKHSPSRTDMPPSSQPEGSPKQQSSPKERTSPHLTLPSSRLASPKKTLPAAVKESELHKRPPSPLGLAQPVPPPPQADRAGASPKAERSVHSKSAGKPESPQRTAALPPADKSAASKSAELAAVSGVSRTGSTEKAAEGTATKVAETAERIATSSEKSAVQKAAASPKKTAALENAKAAAQKALGKAASPKTTSKELSVREGAAPKSTPLKAKADTEVAASKTPKKATPSKTKAPAKENTFDSAMRAQMASGKDGAEMKLMAERWAKKKQERDVQAAKAREMAEATSYPAHGNNQIRMRKETAQNFQRALVKKVEQKCALQFDNLDPGIGVGQLKRGLAPHFNGLEAVHVLPALRAGPHVAGSAVAVFDSRESTAAAARLLARSIICLGDPPRPIVGRRIQASEAKSKFAGPIIVENKNGHYEDQMNAVAVAHASQPNTIEFEFATDWRLLQRRCARMDDLLAERHVAEIERLQQEYRAALKASGS